MSSSEGLSQLLDTAAVVDRRVLPDRRATSRAAPRNAFFRGLALGLLLSAMMWLAIIAAVRAVF